MKNNITVQTLKVNKKIYKAYNTLFTFLKKNLKDVFVTLNNKKVKKFPITFFSSGKITPSVSLCFRNKRKLYQQEFIFMEMMWEKKII